MDITTTAPALFHQTPTKKTKELSIAGIPFYVYAVSIASLLAVSGVLWDISWHRSIGRDKFLSPPHLLIYLGAIFGGLFSGVQVIINSFFSSETTKKGLVKIWGFFYSSLGALFCIWGAIAMLTSAPFDDWWHNAYGLDVKILSPPHTLLVLGMLFLQFGACVSLSKYLNVALNQKKILQLLFIIAASSLVCMFCTLGVEYLDSRNMRDALFYQISAALLLLLLPSLAKELQMKWGMTLISLGYFTLLAGSNWILQLFPAEPKLGPILNHVTHFQGLAFPMLFIFPAIVMDILMQFKMNDWVKAVLLAFVFIILMIAIEYPLSGFILESPASRNWFFSGNSWSYNDPPDWQYRFKFRPHDLQPAGDFLKGIFIALIIGIFSARIGLRLGQWMQKIQR
jgi:hypothetical protein